MACKKYIYGSLILILVFLTTLFSCLPDRGKRGSEVIARVSGNTLTIGEALDNIPEFVLLQDSLRAIQSYANQWIQSQVTLDHAKRIGIQNSPQFRARMDRYQNQLMETLLKEQIMEMNQEQFSVTRDEALSYYQTYREQFTFDEKYVRLRHITTRTRTEAESANRDLVNGIDWETILERYSVNPELQLRQSTQYWPISMAVSDIPPLNQNLQSLGLSERSNIHFYNSRYHLIQLLDEKTEDEYPELDWLIPQITEWLQLEKSRRFINGYLRNLYLQADSNNEIELLNVSDIEQLLAK